MLVKSLSQKKLDVTILFGLVLILGVTLRLYGLGAESYTGDEMYTVIEAQQSVKQLLMSGRLDQPPAYYLPLLLWVKIFGTHEVSTRFYSALMGIGSIILVFWIGRELFGKWVGLLSAFLAAISELQITYSQTSRYYAFFVFALIISFIFFFILSFRSKRKIYFVLYGVASIIMVYSHAFGVFILAAQNLFFFFHGKNARNVIISWIISQAVILIAIVPYFYPIVTGGNMVETALSNTNTTISSPPPRIWEPLETVYKFIFPSRQNRSWENVFTDLFIAVAFLVIGTLLYAVWKGMRNWLVALKELTGSLKEIRDIAKKLFFVGSWLLIPILLPMIISWVVAPVYKDKYMIGAAPALYMLMALSIFSIRKVVPLIVSLITLLIIIVPGLHYYYMSDVNAQWQKVAIYVDDYSEPNDVIVFPNDAEPSTGQIAIKHEVFYWYYQGTLQSCSVNVWPTNPDEILGPLMQCISGHDRFWVISHTYNPELVDRIEEFFLNSNHTNMHLIKEQQFVDISVYLFERLK